MINMALPQTHQEYMDLGENKDAIVKMCNEINSYEQLPLHSSINISSLRDDNEKSRDAEKQAMQQENEAMGHEDVYAKKQAKMRKANDNKTRKTAAKLQYRENKKADKKKKEEEDEQAKKKKEKTDRHNALMAKQKLDSDARKAYLKQNTKKSQRPPTEAEIKRAEMDYKFDNYKKEIAAEMKKDKEEKEKQEEEEKRFYESQNREIQRRKDNYTPYSYKYEKLYRW